MGVDIRWCGISVSQYDNINRVLDFAATCGNYPKKRRILLGIYYGTIWSLWKARNDRIFRKNITTPAIVTDIVKASVFIWFKQRSNGGSNNFNWTKWCINPFAD